MLHLLNHNRTDRLLFLRILIVTEQDSFNEFQVNAKGLGCSVFKVSSPIEANGVLKERRLDLVVVDLKSTFGHLDAITVLCSHCTIHKLEENSVTSFQQTRTLLESVEAKVPLLDNTVIQKIQYLGHLKGRPILANLIRIFESEAPKLIFRINDGILKKDWESVMESAHRLKSDSEALGLIKLSRLVEYIELNPFELSQSVLDCLTAAFQKQSELFFVHCRDS